MILYGASGHAKVVIDICKKSNINISAVVDDNEAIMSILQYPVRMPDTLGNVTDKLIITIGNNAVRKKIAQNLKVEYGNAVHPNSIIDSTSKINKGTVVMSGSIINSSVIIGKHCIVNTASSIDHDCVLEDFVHISPNATLCGGVKVGEGTHIGAGAVIIPNVRVGKWCTIGAGSVVLKDVLDGQKVVGNPSREI